MLSTVETLNEPKNQPRFSISLLKKFDPTSIFVTLISAVILLYIGYFPEIFNLGHNIQSLKSLSAQTSSIHLSDDVMISLRAGMNIRNGGFPDFNSTDLSQPSTSYLTPYIYFYASKIFGNFFGVLAYAFLGLLSYLLTCYVLMRNAKSKLFGFIAILGLTVTSTTRSYSLNGWDHLFQGLFLVIATSIALNNVTKKLSAVVFSLALILALLSRPDSLVLVIGIILTALIRNRENLRIIFKAIIIAFFVFLLFIIANWAHFGWILPTTTRLKFNASPSIGYSANYFFRNGIINYSVITLFCILIVIFCLSINLRKKTALVPLFLSVAVTSFVTTYNSDIFSGGRLYWGVTCVLICAVLIEIESPYKSFRPFKNYQCNQIRLSLVLSFLLLSFSTFGTFSSELRNRVLAISVTDLNKNSSPTSKQYLITRWINMNLDPSDGSIGMFYLGLAYHLPRYEIADFLGKADEVIASSNVKWGPPGHNKWDISKSIAKWNPQVIIPPSNMTELTSEEANLRRGAQADWGFGPDLKLNQTILSDYSYCFISEKYLNQNDFHGFYLKNSLKSIHSNKLNCD
jgi:hypothetical protein